MKNFFIKLTTFLLFSKSSFCQFDKYHDLAVKFAPEVHLHKNELFFPSSIEWFAQRCSLKRRVPNGIWTIIAKPIKNVALLANYPSLDYPRNFQIRNNYFLDPEGDKKTLAGMPCIEGFSPAPCYYHVKERASGGIIIQYIYFYPNNGPTIGFEDKGPSIGSHEGDWEHTDVYLDANGKIEYVYFAAHGSKPFGEMLKPEQISFAQETHPVVYSAQYGHGSHSKNIGFDPKSLDRTSSGGNIWRCWEVPLINLGDRKKPAPGQEWILFGGSWGSTKEVEDKRITTQVTNSPTGPAIDNYWWREEALQKIKITEINALDADQKKQSDYFSLDSSTVPTRIKKIEWRIIHPQAKNISFKINEGRYGSSFGVRSDRSLDEYGRIIDGKVTAISPYNKNIYITGLRGIDKNKVPGTIKIEIWGVEE